MMMLAGSAAAVLAGGMAGQAMAQPAAANTPATAPAAVPGNILLGDWTGAFGGVPPWDKIRPALFPEAFQFGIDEQRREYLAIANNPAPPTFANTIEAMEKAGQRLGRVQAVFGVYDSNLSSPEVQAIDKEWSPKLTAANDEIILNRPLFQRVETLYNNRASLGLDAKQTRLLERTYEYFVRNGAKLDDQQKAQLSAINQKLSSAFTEFNTRLLADEGTFTRASEAEMRGVSQDVKDAAAATAKEKGLPAGTYAIRNTRSAVEPVLTFGDNRALRRRVWQAFAGTRSGFRTEPFPSISREPMPPVMASTAGWAAPPWIGRAIWRWATAS
jgi:peptidyl-dipeptidase Dcp